MAPAPLRFFSGRLRRDPYGAYGELRAAPGAHRSPVGAWVVGRYDDVRGVLTSSTSSSRVWMLAEPDSAVPTRTIFGPRRGEAASERTAHLMRSWLPLTDPPQHTRLRRALTGTLTGQLTGRLRGHIDAITADAVAQLRAGEQVDIVEHLARVVPSRVSAALLGIPEADIDDVAAWSADVARALSPFVGRAELERVEQSLAQLRAYVVELVAARRAAPADDLVSDLVRAQPAHDLDEDELASLVLFVLAASQETMRAALAAAVHLLVTHPAELEEVRRSTRWREAVEETLRCESPVQMTLRRTTDAHPVDGQDIPAGAHVVVVLGSANRDPSAFPDPERFDPGRSPNPHVAFGAGIHACPGAAIAHAELDAALRALFGRFERVELDGDVDWEPSITMRALRSLPVRLTERDA
jgi:cytochrome P450